MNIDLFTYDAYTGRLNNNTVIVLNIYYQNRLIRNMIFDDTNYNYIIKRSQDKFILKYLIKNNICISNNINNKFPSQFKLTLTSKILLQLL